MIPFEVRSVEPKDEDQLLDVARHLNTVNLPNDRTAIAEIVDRSQRSFSGKIRDAAKREYVFVIVDRVKARVVGTSMIVGQLGRRDAPYIFVDVADEEKYSDTLDRHFSHKVLRIGYSYKGPTELGGLIVLPEYRKLPDRVGQLIFSIRFAWIAMHRELFRDELLAELLPPLEPDGTSHLWEALGRHFTGLSYAEADVLSKKNKEFVKSLFPDELIYATLLPSNAQSVIGKVGTQTRGVEKLLTRIGFRYAGRIDPFDGGPHFVAATDSVALIKQTRRTQVAEVELEGRLPQGSARALLLVELPESPFARAVYVPCVDRGPRGIAIGAEAAEVLGVTAGAPLIVQTLS